jgi:EAL domain-containing protein (putative c-di-GMP-specific phosphodiesterase class I)
MEQLDALVALGCNVSLDDFGTGYSSLAYLKTLPVGTIKIDQSFVQDITEDPNDDVIVQTIIGMARNLGLDVVAEGVETAAQRDRLSLYGCTTCQGHLYHRALPPDEFDSLLRQQAGWLQPEAA